jgi:hypothetical protein
VGVALLAPAPLAGDDPAAGVVWDERAAEHLLNRAGFGARPLEIKLAVRDGHVPTVDALLAGPEERSDPYFIERLGGRDGGAKDARDRRAEERGELSDEERRDLNRLMRRRDQRQLWGYTAAWCDAMLEGEDPLRDRMTLFWHGYFTSSMDDVKSSYNLIRQHMFLRDNALGNFGDLVRGIARDPAMLEYLDNRSNRKASPNENFARELMELFTIGEGRYTEDDVREAARAFTGWTDRRGEFHFQQRQHDRGEKTVLGVTGRLDGDDVIDILLAHEACPRWVAGNLIEWLEGTPPDEARLAEYAALLREHDYELTPFLRTLFLDPRFYRDEVVGTRISGPVDHVVGTVRRLDVHAPGGLVVGSSQLLGQYLFHPPNVKGWDEGEAWITTSTLMQRGNLSGVLLGLIELADVVRPDPLEALVVADGMESGMQGDMGGGMQEGMDDGMERVTPGERRAALKVKMRDGMKVLDRVTQSGWTPRINLASRIDRLGIESDEEVVDRLCYELLAVQPDSVMRAELVDFLTVERHELGIEEAALRDGGREAEYLLRRLAHLILCLPEAQLH